MKPILVTGATGFLGKHLVERLKAEGAGGRLRLLCRNASGWDNDPAVTVAHGDITAAEDVSRAVEGAGVVYHLAGSVSRNPRDGWRMHRVHVDGTRHVCEAARRHGVEKLVVVSSSGTIAVSREPILHDENSGYKHEVVGRWSYYLSKIFAEKLALAYWEHDQLPVVVVNPALLLGPGDDHDSSTGDVALFLDGQILTVPPGGMSFIDARDAAAGVIAAMQRGRPGERYLLGGPNWTFRRVVNELGAFSGVRPPLVEVPLGVSLAGAWLLRRLLPLVGKSFLLDAVSIRMSSLFWYCDSSKAVSELGLTIRDPLATLAETVDDLRRRS